MLLVSHDILIHYKFGKSEFFLQKLFRFPLLITVFNLTKEWFEVLNYQLWNLTFSVHSLVIKSYTPQLWFGGRNKGMLGTSSSRIIFLFFYWHLAVFIQSVHWEQWKGFPQAVYHKNHERRCRCIYVWRHNRWKPYWEEHQFSTIQYVWLLVITLFCIIGGFSGI